MEYSSASRPAVPMLNMPHTHAGEQPQTQRAPRLTPRGSYRYARDGYGTQTPMTESALDAHNNSYYNDDANAADERTPTAQSPISPTQPTALGRVAKVIYTMRFPIIFVAAAYGGVPLHKLCLQYAHYFTYRELNDLEGSSRGGIAYPTSPANLSMSDITSRGIGSNSAEDSNPATAWAEEASNGISAPVKAIVGAVMHALGIPTLRQLRVRQQARNAADDREVDNGRGEGGGSSEGGEGESSQVAITSLPIGVVVPFAALIALLVARYVLVKPLPRDNETLATIDDANNIREDEMRYNSNFNAFGDSALAEKRSINEALQRMQYQDDEDALAAQKRRINNTLSDYDMAEKSSVNASLERVNNEYNPRSKTNTPNHRAGVGTDADGFVAVEKPMMIQPQRESNQSVDTGRRLELTDDLATKRSLNANVGNNTNNSRSHSGMIDHSGLVSDTHATTSDTHAASTATDGSSTHTARHTHTTHSSTVISQYKIVATEQRSISPSNTTAAAQPKPNASNMLAAVRRTAELNRLRIADEGNDGPLADKDAGTALSSHQQTHSISTRSATTTSSTSSAVHHHHRVLVEEPVVMLALPVPSSVEDVQSLLREAYKHKIRRVVIPDVHDHFRLVGHDAPIHNHSNFPAIIRIPEGVEVEEVANVRQFCVASRDLVPSIAVHRNVSSPLIATSQPTAGSSTPLGRHGSALNEASTASSPSSSISRAPSFFQGTSRYTGLQWFNHPFNAIYVFDTLAVPEGGTYNDGGEASSPLMPNFDGNGPLAWCDYHVFLDSSSSPTSPVSQNSPHQSLNGLINLVLYHRSVKPPRRTSVGGEVTAPSRHSPLKRAKYVSSLALQD